MDHRDAHDQDRRTEGVAFPVVDGSRSTTATATAVLSAAAAPVSPELARTIEAERNWRDRYVDHVRALVEAELRAEPHAAAAVPAAGLHALHERFVYVREGQDLPLRDGVTQPSGELGTVELRGEGQRGRLEVPYAGRTLHGDALRRQLEDWVRRDIVEPSFADAVGQVIAHPDWLDLSDLSFAVLGAGAEMGPLASLCSWGATVLPVDLPRRPLWETILAAVRAGSGRALIPVQRPVPAGATDTEIAGAAGVDLLTQVGEVAAWLAQAPGPLTIGNYVYADGGDFVRVSMAVDAVTAHLLEARDDVSIAVLVTPTDVYAVPLEVVRASATAREARGPMRAVVRGATGGRLFAANYTGTVTTPTGDEFGIADSLITQQGPNYALAKRLHGWRARAAREGGAVASLNVAPATRTRSVTKNRILRAAYDGAHRFGVEVFEPDTSNTLMAAVLVHDLRSPKSSAQPDVTLPHPHSLFAEGAAHGGFWRLPDAPRTVLPLAALAGLISPVRRA